MHVNETTRCEDEDDFIEPSYRVDDDGRFTWTEEGLRTYRQRFARFGLRIEALYTLEAYRTALTLYAAGFQDQLRE